MKLEQYIFPIYNGDTIIGQGFVADGYFITAAHVVKDYPFCYVVLKEKRLVLSQEEPVLMGKDDIYHDEKTMDIVVYSYDNVASLLHLSEYIPQRGDQLNSLCVHEVSIPFSLKKVAPQVATLDVSQEQSIVTGREEGNYFYCHCKRYGGSSGSPLIKGNEVVGIMHGGDDNGLCAFLKSQVINQQLRQIELEIEKSNLVRSE